MKQPDLAALGMISDRHTCALLDREGTISWYCPGAFDRPALLSSLIDAQQGGYWTVEAPGKTFVHRKFDGRSSVLYTTFSTAMGECRLTDFMPLRAGFSGICRMLAPSAVDISGAIRLRADYGLEAVELLHDESHTVSVKEMGQWLHCSHALHLEGDTIQYKIPAGERGWIALLDCDAIDTNTLDASLAATLELWKEIEGHLSYSGPYENEVCSSLRALQQLVYEPTGGIIAAPTIGLPEVIGGGRNYDYRYVWMRDAALIASSLVGLETDGLVEQKFIKFVAAAMKKNGQSHVSCFYGIDYGIRDEAHDLPLQGYRDSRPVTVGNIAADQFQLDAESGILLACQSIYQKYDCRIEWDTVEAVAEYICENWERKDNGIWEEEQRQHYTSSKAFAARGLEVMAAYQTDPQKADRWLYNARLIREFIQQNCITSYGAYAVYAGSEDVDITSALFVPFAFDTPDSTFMQSTVAELEAHYQEGNLYRRHLVEFDSAKEGVFLAASCWMAHYYAMAGNLEKAKAILDAMLGCANDLGYFSEEMDLKTNTMLGNFPQTFVHSSFICAVNGYKDAWAARAVELPVLSK